MTTLLLFSLMLQGAAATPSPAQTATTAPIILPKGTTIQLAVVHALSSSDSKVGQQIAFTVAEDVLDVQGHVLIHKGASVEGTVTAVESQPKIDHLRGLIGVTATVVHLPGGVDVPLQIQTKDPKLGDFRTRENQIPPEPTVAERTTFYATKQPQNASNLMQAVAASAGETPAASRGSSGKGAGAPPTGSSSAPAKPPSGGSGAGQSSAASVFQDPLEESSAVLLSQIVDFKQSQAMIQSIGQSNLVVLVQSLSGRQGISEFAHKFSATSAVTMVGAGVGLYKLAGMGSALFFRHVSIAPGALFKATTAADCTVQVPLPPGGPRGPWHIHVKILKPKKYTNRPNRHFVPDGKPKQLHHGGGAR